MPNPSGNYSRIKTWSAGDTILAADVNAEFDNVLSNFNPEMLAGYSQNQAQMQTQTAPGSVGSESLAQSLSGELERLRYQINAIQGTTYWYQTPATTITQINSIIGAAAYGNRINSGRTAGTTGSTQPMFLVAANSTNSVTVKGGTTALSYGIAGTTYAISTDVTLTGLTVAPSSQNTATVSDLTLVQAGTASSQLLGENGSTITVSSMGTNITALAGKLAAFKTTASEYLIGRVESTTQIRSCYRGFFFNSSDALVSRGTLSNGDTLTLMKLAWIYANTAGGLQVSYTNPTAGGYTPSSPAASDYWFDTSVNYWKTYNGSAWVTANATLIGLAITDTSNTVATRSFDFFGSFSDLNTVELFADSQNSGTVVRSRLRDGQVSVYGSIINLSGSFISWDFALNMDTGAQAASTTYYFYLDTNGKPFISKTPPFDRRGDLKGYYHPSNPWRCLGYGFSNALTLVEKVESFFRSDDTSPVSNITAANNQSILPYNIIQREQVITLTGAAGAFTQVLPPPSQLKGKFITYVRTDNNPGTAVTLQSWGTAVGNITGTLTANSVVMSGLSGTSGLAAGQLITGIGVPPNTLLVSLAGATAATMSAAATITFTAGTYNYANAAGYSGTVGQQTGYVNYGINGIFTYALYSQHESVTLTSDGYAYFVVNHRAVTPWVPSSIVGDPTACGTISLNAIWERRVGDTLQVKGSFRCGTVTANPFSLNLPAGYVIDAAKMHTTALVEYVGTINELESAVSIAGGTAGPFPLIWDSTVNNKIFTSKVGGAGPLYQKANGSAITSTNQGLNFKFEVPIVGWQP